jgi:hypothetical protein
MGSDVPPLGMSEEHPACDGTRVRTTPVDVQHSSSSARNPLAMCNRHDAAVLTSVCVCACARLRLHEQTGEGFPQNALCETEGKSGSFLMIEAPDHHEEEARVVGVALCCVAMGATPSTQRVEIATHSRLPSVWLKGSAKQSPHF